MAAIFILLSGAEAGIYWENEVSMMAVDAPPPCIARSNGIDYIR